VKIREEHYAHMLAKMKPFSPEIADMRAEIIAEGKAKDIDKRLRWDLARNAGLIPWICDYVYPYANDDHVDTALRRVMMQIEA
jgi:hypothetical protein